MSQTCETVAVLHPGRMGSAVAAGLKTSGSRVVWASKDRSKASAQRAQGAGLEDVDTLTAVAEQADAIVVVCPPGEAAAVASSVRVTGFSGIYVDANALSPRQMSDVADIMGETASSVVDGCIIGHPPTKVGMTRFYLAGDSAADIAALFSHSYFEAVVLGDAIGQASAMKMSYAAYTKGSWALEASCLALARHYGLQDQLAREWDLMREGRMQEVEVNLRMSGPKAWRFLGEMDQISETFGSVGLPSKFHEAAQDVYRKWESFKGAEHPPLSDLIRSLLEEDDRPAGT